MSKTLKVIFYTIGAVILLYIGYLVFIAISVHYLFENGNMYSKRDLVENYTSRESQINEVKTYFNSIVPAGKSIDIEFEGSNRIAIFHVNGSNSYESNWDLKLNSAKVDTILSMVGWSRATLKTLKEKLDAANCISVKSGEPLNIGFQRSGMGKYYYNIFEKPIPDTLKSRYNDSCTFILYNEKVVLEYGGGAIGPQCFPTK